MRHRPPPLLRLSAGAGPHALGKEEHRLPSATDQYMYSPSLHAPPLSVVAPFHNIPPEEVHALSNHHGRSQSTVAPLLPPMFRIGSRSKSPRRAASAMYSANGVNKSTTDMHPGSPVTIANMPTVGDPHPRPFSPWGSTDSQSSTSPRNSKAQKGAYGKRSLSPTASVAPSVSNMSIKSRSTSKGFLGRGRKQSSNLTEEFDPTTFRKNRPRPSRGGMGGQDALYHEYDDLFDDSLEERAETDDSHTSDGGEDDPDGFFLLQVEEHPERTTSLEESPHLSPKTRRVSEEPRSVPAVPLAYPTRDGSSPPPPPPPKSWRRSLHPTTPPHSSTPSVDEPLEAPSNTLSAPPTPPPKAAPPALTIETNINSAGQALPKELPAITGSPSPPQNAPPVTPPLRRKRFSRRVSTISARSGNGRPRSIPDGLGIINIPSPTLFSSEFSAAAGETWAEYAGSGHALSPPALTGNSFTPRQPTFRRSAQYDPSMVKYDDDEGDPGIQSDPGEGAADDYPRSRKFSADSRNGYDGSEAGTIKVRLDRRTDSDAGVNSATTDKSVETLLDSMLSESEMSGKEEVAEIQRNRSLKRKQSNAPAQIYDEKEVVVVVAESGLEVDTRSKHPAAPSETKKESEGPKEEDQEKLDAAYLRAFKAMLKTAGESDPFNYRFPRYDRVQAQRIFTGDNSSQPPLVPRRNSKARQDAAKEDIVTGMYTLMAMRWLEFGKVITSPAHETLLTASVAHLTRRATKMDRRATQMLASVNGKPTLENALQPAAGENRRRVLDLGGLPVADWGWHCASDYPKVKVYTVTQRPFRASESPNTPAPSPPFVSHCRGPKNHRHLTVDRLCRLPFPANHFDVVSARSLFLTLKIQAPSKTSSQTIDEYERCLEECMRVLKPGGYLEFTLIDTEIINPGPVGEQMSGRFSSELRAKGYDAEPTKRWVSRLNRAGFEDIKRAWLFLPMAPPAPKPKVPSKMDNRTSENSQMEVEEEVRRKMEAWEDLGVKKGTLANVAPITGLVGGYIWEKWMSSAGISEVLEEEGSSLSALMDEGKDKGSGWRALIGWARKPSA